MCGAPSLLWGAGVRWRVYDSRLQGFLVISQEDLRGLQRSKFAAFGDAPTIKDQACVGCAIRA